MGIVVYFPAVDPPDANAASGGVNPKEATVKAAPPVKALSKRTRRDVGGLGIS